MARFLLLPALLGLVTGLSLACSDDSGGSVEDERSKLERDFNEQLDEMNSQIKDLENQVQGQGGGNIDEAAKQRLDDLKDERADLQNKLNDVRTASEERLRELKADVETKLNDLKEQLE